MYVDLCRHIRSNGIQCHAIALTDQHFCYFHRRLNQGHAIYRDRMVGTKGLMERGHIIALPPLEDRVSVMLALSEVINALACNFIEPKRANALFFGLKLAVLNCKGLEAIPQQQEKQVVRDFGPAPDLLDSVAVDLAPEGLTYEIDDENNPAIFLNPGLMPGTYDQRTISATPVKPFPGAAVPPHAAEPPDDDAFGPADPAIAADIREYLSRPSPSLNIRAVATSISPQPCHPERRSALAPNAVEEPVLSLSKEPAVASPPASNLALTSTATYNQPNPHRCSPQRTTVNEQRTTSENDHHPHPRSAYLRRRFARPCVQRSCPHPGQHPDPAHPAHHPHHPADVRGHGHGH